MVGTWSRTSADVELFSYEASWSDSPSARPLSLTLPFLPGNEQHRGPNVGAWFENLLPDSSAIRTRMACRLGVSNNPRSLLADIGRDCVGAVQLLGFDVATVELATFREDDSTERALVAADYLDSEEVIAEHLNVALASEHQDLFLQAIANVAKARGMAQLAKDTGMVRESLYKALATGAKPRYACYIMIRPRGGALRQVHNRTRHR